MELTSLSAFSLLFYVLISFSLRHISQTEWHSQVDIIAHDMRTWQAPELCDILVSELLGSFGDNELSPECLDGAQRFLKPDTGISIPQNSISYIAPISSSKLWSEVKAYDQLKVTKHGKLTTARPSCMTLVFGDGVDDACIFANGLLVSFFSSLVLPPHGFIAYVLPLSILKPPML